MIQDDHHFRFCIFGFFLLRLFDVVHLLGYDPLVFVLKLFFDSVLLYFYAGFILSVIVI